MDNTNPATIVHVLSSGPPKMKVNAVAMMVISCSRTKSVVIVMRTDLLSRYSALTEGFVVSTRWADTLKCTRTPLHEHELDNKVQDSWEYRLPDHPAKARPG